MRDSGREQFVVDFVSGKTTVKERLRGRGSYVLITKTTKNTTRKRKRKAT